MKIKDVVKNAIEDLVNNSSNAKDIAENNIKMVPLNIALRWVSEIDKCSTSNMEISMLSEKEVYQAIIDFKIKNKLFINDNDVRQEAFYICAKFPTTKPAMTPLEWFLTPNPLLGNVIPVEMIKQGRGENLCKFIINQLDENTLTTAKPVKEELDEKKGLAFLIKFYNDGSSMNGETVRETQERFMRDFCAKFAVTNKPTVIVPSVGELLDVLERNLKIKNVAGLNIITGGTNCVTAIHALMLGKGK